MNPKEYKKILRGAIQAELEAHNFYKEVSQKVADPHLKEMFLSFSDEELKHKKLLEAFESGAKGTLQFKEVPDFNISETVDKPKLSIDMKPKDALALAMKNEEEAMTQYTLLAEAATDPEIKETFRQLAAMERDHKHQIETAFTDIGFPEVW